ncbi:aspartate/glutamate racemase family protein [Actinoplanes sp. NPDC023801]|uniref:aspartate/glutamate racemase family protein n=1 Tax=Actinoplanes sp. NPDC023801 TaxID=3154595 RepID=UPI0033C0D9B6
MTPAYPRWCRTCRQPRAAGVRPCPDRYVVAWSGDPGRHAAREVAAGPVVGIAGAAMHAAMLVGRGFSVVTTLGRTAAARARTCTPVRSRSWSSSPVPRCCREWPPRPARP